MCERERLNVGLNKLPFNGSKASTEEFLNVVSLFLLNFCQSC